MWGGDRKHAKKEKTEQPENIRKQQQNKETSVLTCNKHFFIHYIYF
jgi:hypothetical protein